MSVKRRRLQQAAALFVILAATFGLYISCWDNPFVLDDLTKIQQNPDMQVTSFDLANFVFSYPEMTTQLHNDPSRPLTYIVYWLCWQFSGNDPTYFHVVSTFAHAGIAMLLLLVTAELMLQFFGFYSLTAGFVAASVFLSAPLIAGTVVYVYGLSDLLSGFFILLAYFVLIRQQPVSRFYRLSTTLLACLCFLLALASKQSSVVIAPLIIATDIFTRRKNLRQRAYEIYVPLVSLCIAYIVFRFIYFGAIGDLEGRGSTVKPLSYLLFQGAMILKYIKMTLYPTGFTIDHLFQPGDISLAAQLLSWSAISMVSFASVRAAFKGNSSALARWLSLGWLFFLICLLPTSSFLPTVDMFVERRAYIANLGLYMMVGGIIALLLRNSRTIAMVTAVLTFAFVGMQIYVTLQRTKVYASTEKLWQESLALDNLNFRARTNLAVHYSATKEYEKARIALEELIPYDPSNGGIYSKLGYIYMQPDYQYHDDQKAWSYLEKSLKLLPDNIFALYNGGVIQLKHGGFAQAEKLLMHATELNPLMASAWLRAGEAALFQGKRDAAIFRFRKALSLNDNQQDAKMYLNKMGVSEQ